MKKTIFALIAVLMVLSLVLTACKTEATPAAEVEEPAADVPAAEEAPVDDAFGGPAECADNPDEKVCAVFAPGDVIKIGFGGPMSGDPAAFGTDISQGAQIAFDQFAGVDGWTVELVVEDTQGAPEGGASVATLLASDPDVVAIAGHIFSGATETAIPIYKDARLPMLSPSATMETLTQGDQDVFNRIPFTDNIQAAFAAKYLYDILGVSTIAVINDGDAYGKGLADTVASEFEALGGTVVANESITAGETDYTAVLTAIAAYAPEAIFFGGYYAEGAVLATNMEVAGLGDAIFFSDDGIFGDAFIAQAGAAAEGTYAGASALPADSEAKLAFDAAYEEAYGIKPGSLSTYTWHGFDIANVLLTALSDVAVVGEDGNLYVSREAMVAAVRGTTGYQGLTGEITCDAVGECNALGPTFFVVENGVWVEAPTE
ncbi:MAG: branched-chain amino acid ABC transporter substrate-binding protein [Anaerolineales bacterium]|nr:branched-chain amino acid ABC transporter substrate-binding protein [Anaerolineales bacterium]